MLIIRGLIPFLIWMISWVNFVIAQCPAHVRNDVSQGVIQIDFSSTLRFLTLQRLESGGQLPRSGNGGKGKSLIPLVRSVTQGHNCERQCLSDGVVGLLKDKFDVGIESSLFGLRVSKRKVDTQLDYAALPAGAMQSVESAKEFWKNTTKRRRLVRRGFKMEVSEMELIVIDSDDDDVESTAATTKLAGVGGQLPMKP